MHLVGILILFILINAMSDLANAIIWTVPLYFGGVFVFLGGASSDAELMRRP